MPDHVSYCLSCFDGSYPAGKPESFTKAILEN